MPYDSNHLPLPKYLNEKNFLETDIYHTPSHDIPIPYLIKKNKKIISFITIHDLIPIIYPQYVSLPFLKNVMKTYASIDKNSWICCPSEQTKSDLITHLLVDPNKIFVTQEAADPSLFYPCHNSDIFKKIRKKYALIDTPYFLHIGRLESRKNVSMMIKSFAKLIQDHHIKDLNLLLLGPYTRSTPEIARTYQEVINKQGLSNRCIHLPFVEDHDLASFYSHAIGFLFLSHYEGFGLPLLEAMSCGTPLIVSNTSSIPEVVGNAGLLVHPENQEVIVENMLSLYQSNRLQESLSKKGLLRSKQFSWDKTINRTILAYKTALNQ